MTYARPVDDDHALLVGALVGMVHRARAEGFDYTPEILDDGQNWHLATFRITAPSGRYLVHVEKLVGQDGEEDTQTEPGDHDGG